MGLDLLDIELNFERAFGVRLPPYRSRGPEPRAMERQWQSRQPPDLTAAELLNWFLARVHELPATASATARVRPPKPLPGDPAEAWPIFQAILVRCLAVDAAEVRQESWLVRDLGMA